MDLFSYFFTKSTSGGGGDSPTLITKQITENGTYTAADDNADGYSEVKVEVYDSQFAALIERSITIASDSNIKEIEAYAFTNCVYLTSISFPNVINVSNLGFSGCKSLSDVNLPSVKTIGDRGFTSCTALKYISLPSLTTLGARNFESCTSLERVELPSATQLNGSAFRYALNVKTLVLGTRATLTGTEGGWQTVVVYVKNSDLEWYSTATNWSAIYAEGRIKSIDELPPEEATV